MLQKTGVMALLSVMLQLVGTRGLGEYNYGECHRMGSEVKVAWQAVPFQLSSVLAAIRML